MNKGADTSLGGAWRSFPATTWGMVSRLRDASPAAAAGGLDTMCRRYWKAVYTYIRVAWHKSNEETKDLTQAFFLWLMEEEPLRKFVPDRGGFRGYLKVLLRRFVGHRDVADRRLKRGGDVVHVPLEGDVSETATLPSGISAEEAFDATWLSTVLEHAVAEVRSALESRGRHVAFQVFEAHDLCPAEKPPTYAEIAGRLGLKETQVRDHLAAVREQVRAVAREELRRVTVDDEELRGEWRELFGA